MRSLGRWHTFIFLRYATKKSLSNDKYQIYFHVSQKFVITHMFSLSSASSCSTAFLLLRVSCPYSRILFSSNCHLRGLLLSNIAVIFPMFLRKCFCFFILRVCMTTFVISIGLGILMSNFLSSVKILIRYFNFCNHFNFSNLQIAYKNAPFTKKIYILFSYNSLEIVTTLVTSMIQQWLRLTRELSWMPDIRLGNPFSSQSFYLAGDHVKSHIVDSMIRSVRHSWRKIYPVNLEMEEA